MGKIDIKVKQNPQLKRKALADGRESLYLEYYLGSERVPQVDIKGEPVCYPDDLMTTDKETGLPVPSPMRGKQKFTVKHKRKKESLGLYLVNNARTKADRELNREALEVASRIRFEREQQLKEQKDGFSLQRDSDVDFLQFYQAYISKYAKRDIRMVQAAYNQFTDFLSDEPKYNHYKDGFKASKLDRDMMRLFAEYLQKRGRGSGPKTIYQRFKKVVNYGVEHGYIRNNPCKGVVIRCDEKTLSKDILSMEEIQSLISTHYDNENPQIRDAFIFCLCTGLRFCDVNALTYQNIDFSNRILTFEQHKTAGHSSASRVSMPLSDTALQLIGKPIASQQEKIFLLPSNTMCLKALRRWTKRAGIDKHITWHCARHSFATNNLMNGANIAVVGALLGHSGLQHTQKYLRAVDAQKQEAVNKMVFDL